MRALVLIGLLAGCGSAERLPELMSLTDFELVDQNQHPFGTAELRGKVWIADAFFTSCPDICPVQTSQLANLFRRLPDRDDLRVVSITVDPEVDTPARLREYRQRYGISSARWSFLTGDRESVRGAMERSLRMPMGSRQGGDRYSITHGGRFLLIDRHLKLRALYSTDGAGLDALARDAAALLEE